MEELVKRVSEQAGISEDQARAAVNAVASFLREKVPPAYAGYIDTFFGPAGGSVDNTATIGGIFGKE